MDSRYPEAATGLQRANFRKVSSNGFGDRYNAYAHAMAWWENKLYVGTTRANLHLIQAGMKYVKIDQWPVEILYPVYGKDFEYICARSEIWRFDPLDGSWEQVFQAPIVLSDRGEEMARELGFRGMVIFQGKSDTKPVIYTSTWSRSRGPGPLILRSEDGKEFVPVSEPGIVGLPITSLRLLVPFKDRLFLAPTGAAKGFANSSGVPIIFESHDPGSGVWAPINEIGFGDKTNLTIFEMRGFGDYLYAGAANLKGFQIWRSRVEGTPPYTDWELVIEQGAERGPLNQGTAAMIEFKGALYVGTGIQNGGYDQMNKVGPAGAEIIRIHPDKSWDLIMGMARNGRRPLSGLLPGFNNMMNGYLWRLGIYDNWLYAGTYDWTIFLRYTHFAKKPHNIFRLLERVGAENMVASQGGFELWRSFDGENWLPVTRSGFENPYNYGIRNIIPTPHGVFIGTANPFGPRVAVRIGEGWDWEYQDNPQGGLEIWQGMA